MADTAGMADRADGPGATSAAGAGVAGGSWGRSGWARRGTALAMGLSLVIGAAACGGGSSKKTATTDKQQTQTSTSDSSSNHSGDSHSSDSNSESSFVDAANKICTDGNSQYGAELEKVGEQHKPDTAEWAAGQSEALQGVEQHAVQAFGDLSLPDDQMAGFKSYVSMVE